MVRIWGFHSHGLGLIPGYKTEILQAAWHGQNRNRNCWICSASVRRRGRIRVQVTQRGQAESEAARGERGLWAKGEQGRQGLGLEGWGPEPGVYHRGVKLPCGV